jgi:hypothetical protein
MASVRASDAAKRPNLEWKFIEVWLERSFRPPCTKAEWTTWPSKSLMMSFEEFIPEIPGPGTTCTT